MPRRAMSVRLPESANQTLSPPNPTGGGSLLSPATITLWPALLIAPVAKMASKVTPGMPGTGLPRRATIARLPEPGFPTAVGPDLSFNGGDEDAFVAKVNAEGSTIEYAGYIGGERTNKLVGLPSTARETCT